MHADLTIKVHNHVYMYVNFITNHYDALLPFSGGRDVRVWQRRNVGQARDDVYIFYQRLIQPSCRLYLP